MAALTIRVLGLARRETLLPDECRLLVTYNASNLDASERPIVDLSVDLCAALDRGQNANIDSEKVAELGVPRLLAQVHEHGAACVARVGDVRLPVGEVIHEPGVDRAEEERLLVVCLLDVREVVQHPAELRGGKVGAEGQAGLPLDGIDALFVRLGELLDGVRRARVRPGDAPREGLARVAVPHDGRLPLVGDANDLYVLAGVLGARGARDGLELLDRLLNADVDLVDNLVRVLVLPAGVVVELRELELVKGNDGGLLVEEHEADRRGAGVDGAHEVVCAWGGHGVQRKGGCYVGVVALTECMRSCW